MKHLFSKSVLLLVPLVILALFISTFAFVQGTASASGRWCVASGCNGFLENAKSPPCSIGEQIFKSDNVFDSRGVLVGVLDIFVSFSNSGPSSGNSDCASFWGGFRASVNGLQGVHGAVGNLNTQSEQGPTSNLNSGQWVSSFMFTFLQNPSCQSAWISGRNSGNGASFSHKAIAGGSGC